MYSDYYGASAYGTVDTTAIMSMMSTIMGITGVIYILMIVAQWRIFTKAGEAGWKSLIPIYNVITLFKIIGLSPWLILLYLTAIIPFVGYIAVLVLTVIQCNKLSKAFGQGTGFTVGLFFLGPIFQLILAFGSAEYVGPAEKSE